MERVKRNYVLKVKVTQYEKARTAANATACGMTMSSYTRTLLNGSIPNSLNELGDMKEIFRLHADLGRLGGLLKMLLTNDERLNDMGREMATVTIDNVLIDIRVTQDLLKKEVIAVLSRRKRATSLEPDEE